MVGVRAAGVRRWLRESLADRARRMVLVLVLLLWLAVAGVGVLRYDQPTISGGPSRSPAWMPESLHLVEPGSWEAELICLWWGR